MKFTTLTFLALFGAAFAQEAAAEEGSQLLKREPLRKLLKNYRKGDCSKAICIMPLKRDSTGLPTGEIAFTEDDAHVAEEEAALAKRSAEPLRKYIKDYRKGDCKNRICVMPLKRSEDGLPTGDIEITEEHDDFDIEETIQKRDAMPLRKLLKDYKKGDCKNRICLLPLKRSADPEADPLRKMLKDYKKGDCKNRICLLPLKREAAPEPQPLRKLLKDYKKGDCKNRICLLPLKRSEDGTVLSPEETYESHESA